MREIRPAWLASYAERAIRGRNRPTAGGLSTDHLAQILDTGNPPWRYLVNLTITTATGELLGGSGWLLGPRTVVTAGRSGVYPSIAAADSSTVVAWTSAQAEGSVVVVERR